ncbi:DNA lyase [Gammaproteobacteria bacterium]
MRLWSLHPQYLDARGLVALWREALLAQAVILGRTRGYKHHPQLVRFLESPIPSASIAAYLRVVRAEADHRGYRFDGSKIGEGGDVDILSVTSGQIEYEWRHLTRKLEVRDPGWLTQLPVASPPKAHPLFRVVAGEVAAWEVILDQQAKRRAESALA